jgi:uncharacterized protein (TIGR02466 family)
MTGIIKAFETPIYYGTVDGFDLVQSEICEFVETHGDLINPPPAEWDETVLTSFTYDDKRSKELVVHHLPSLSNQIVVQVRKYLEMIGNEKPYIIHIDDMWVNVYRPNDYMNMHDHKSVDISGVYYFQTNTEDGDIVFNNPCDLMSYTKLLGDIDKNVFKVKPEEGKMLLFPGWLKHSVNRNKTDSNRISVSFNIVLTGTG